MSALSIKTAVASLLGTLVDANGVTLLRTIRTQIDRGTKLQECPKAMLWDTGFSERRIGSGNGLPQGKQNGLKLRTWTLVTHLQQILKNTETEGGAFDTLTESVEALYRNEITLSGLADVTSPYSRIFNFAEVMHSNRPSPRDEGIYVLYEYTITASVDELLNA